MGLKRVALGVATGGLSEAYRFGKNETNLAADRAAREIPEAEAAQFSGQTAELGNQIQDAAKQSREQIAASNMQGAQAASQDLLNQPYKPGAFEVAGDDALQQAIGKRASRDYSSSLARQQLSQKLKAGDELVNRERRAQSAAAAQSAYETQKYQREQQTIAARKMARAQVIGAVIGTVGKIAGMAIGAAVGNPFAGGGGQPQQQGQTFAGGGDRVRQDPFKNSTGPTMMA